MMIVPPFAAPQGFTNAFCPQDAREALWFIFSGDKLLINSDTNDLPAAPSFLLRRKISIGTLGKKHLFTGEAEREELCTPGWHWSSLRKLYGTIADENYAIAGRAMQLLEWDRSHAFCGRCGSKTFPRKAERCRECSSCGHLAWPKLSPAIIALVKKERKILLARNPSVQFYSAIAGFVDPGETLEQCVAREVFEETQLQVNNIKYFGSQPWPFSGCLMVAFTCDWMNGKIHINPSELEHADWFGDADLPQLPPPLSISRILIDSYLNSQILNESK